MGESKRAAGRLALREEGNWWNAYYAEPGTMEGAVLIGSIALGFVGRSDAIKQAFMQTMVLVVQDFLREITGQEASWGEPEVAAEHERAGRA